MKTITKFCIFIIFILAFVSCENSLQMENIAQNIMSTQEASDKFSEILSRAIYDSEAVRRFIKDEAIEKFDNDYDVFYPFVKDKVVENNITFREVLLKYISDESELSKIEEALPLLNIYVPDLGWFLEQGFSANNWDISNPEIAVFSSETNNIYGSGDLMGQLPSDAVPASPLLVVKNNERLVAKLPTKGDGTVVYEFRSDVYDKSKNIITKVEYVEDERELPVEVCDSYYPASGLHSSVISAWNEFGNVTNAAERDYVYYGMTKTKTTGTHNKRAKELLLRFRLDPQSYIRIADDSSEDPVFTGEDDKIKKTDYTDAQILSKIWKDGQFEIEMDVVVALKSGGVSSQKLVFDIAPSDIYQMTKISYKFWHKTWFTNRKWQYTFDLITVNSKVQNLTSKWYYPKENTMIVPWDLYNESNDILIYAREIDVSKTVKETKSKTFKFSNNFSVNVGFDIKKVSLGVSNSAYVETSSSRSYEITYQTESDNLGSICLRYSDPVITGKRTQNGATEYKIFSYSTGSLEMCFVPYVY